ANRCGAKGRKAWTSPPRTASTDTREAPGSRFVARWRGGPAPQDRAVSCSRPMRHLRELVMLHLLDIVKKRLNELEEFLEPCLAAKAFKVVISRFPFDAKNIACRFFRAM